MPPPHEMTAFIDESHQLQPGVYDFYTMTAALVDYSRDLDRRSLMAELHHIASKLPPDRQGRHAIHANKMAGQFLPELQTVQHLMATSAAVRMVMTVRTRTSDVRNDEDARQTCLADLATRLNSIEGLSRVVMDSRDDLTRRGQHQTRKPDPYGPNAIDLGTINDLQHVKEVSPAWTVTFADDVWADQLWLADVASYVAARSIARKDPGYMAILASKIEIHEATVLPVSMRRPGHTTLEPSSLELVLHDHWSTAYSLSLGLPVPVSLIPDAREREFTLAPERIESVDSINFEHREVGSTND